MGNFRKISRPSLVFGKYGFEGGQLHDVQDIAVGSHIYVTDSIVGAVSLYDTNGKFLRRVPQTMFDRSRPMLESDTRNGLYNVQEITGIDGSWPFVLRRSQSRPGYLDISSKICEPFGIAVTKDERIFFTDRLTNQVYASDASCTTVRSLSHPTLLNIRISQLGGIDVHLGKVFCIDTELCQVLIMDDDGKYMGKFGKDGDKDGEFCRPVYLCIDKAVDRLIISDTLNSRVQVLTLDGRHQMTLGTQWPLKGGLKEPSGVGVDDSGNIYVADTQLHCVQVFSRTGEYLQSFGGYGKVEGLFRSPKGVTLSSNGKVYVVDNINCRIQVF